MIDVDGVTTNYIILFLDTIIIPWLILIERRLSRIEGYLRAKVGYNGAR